MVTSMQRWCKIKEILPLGSQVRGVVTRVEPFGVLVKLASTDITGVLLVTHFEDGERAFQLHEYPQVGEVLEAVVVDHCEHNMQVRLSTRASDMKQDKVGE
jgi:ribosomal protein S1